LVHFVNTERSNKIVIYFKNSSICVSPGFGGLTGDTPAVRPAAAAGAGRRLRWSDRLIYTGQTGGIRTVRPTDLSRSDQLPSNLRRTEENPNKPHVILPIPLSSSDAVPNCSIEPSSPKEY
jgi:hypothetical protein